MTVVTTDRLVKLLRLVVGLEELDYETMLIDGVSSTAALRHRRAAVQVVGVAEELMSSHVNH